MNDVDPPRLRDGEGDLADLLRQGYADLPDDDEMSRFEPRLDPPPPAPRPPLARPLLKAAGALGVAAAVVGLGASLRAPPPGPPPAVALAVAPSALASEAPAPSAPPADASSEPAPPEPPRRSPSAPRGQPSRPALSAPSAPAPPPAAPSPAPAAASSAAPAAPAVDPTLELSLLDRARRKVASSPAEALALAGEHAQLFPRSAFSMEREVIVIEALARSGRRPEAQERARRLLDASPRSAYRQRLEPLLR